MILGNKFGEFSRLFILRTDKKLKKKNYEYLIEICYIYSLKILFHTKGILSCENDCILQVATNLSQLL